MKRLTFSFDNGPVPGKTERVLDFLRDRGIPATFFVVGAHLDDPRRRALAERAHGEGHWIGNHTLSHGPPLGASSGAGGGAAEESAARAAREIAEAERRIGPLAHPRKFFRPNGAGSLGPHLLSPGALAHLKANRYTVVTWNNVPGDWIEPREAWLGKALATVEEMDWSLLVLHDEHIGDMMGLLERFCDELDRGGVAIEQEFPPECVILDRGVVVAPLEGYVASGEEGA